MPWAHLVARSGASHPEQTQDSQVPSLGFRKSVRSKKRIQAWIRGHQILPAKWKLPSLPISVKATQSSWANERKAGNDGRTTFRDDSNPHPTPSPRLGPRKVGFFGAILFKISFRDPRKIVLKTAKGKPNTTKTTQCWRRSISFLDHLALTMCWKPMGQIFSLQSENGMKRALY